MPPKGGRRPGAGRPKSEKTCTVRVPIRLKKYVSKLDLLINLISSWQQKAQGKTSPRYEQLQVFLDELKMIIEMHELIDEEEKIENDE